jgi:hypothetical protein
LNAETQPAAPDDVLSSLEKLKEYTDKKSDPKIVEERKLLWSDIIHSLQLPRDEVEKVIVDALNCQVITVRRWMDGKYAPRPLAIEALVKFFTIRIHGRMLDPEIRSEEMIQFHDSEIAVRRLEHFFHCLQFAKLGMHVRGWYGYRMNRYPGARSALLGLLRRSECNFQMHYLYAPETDADRALRGFLQHLRTLNEPELEKKVFAWHTSQAGSADDILRYNIASPFIVIYNATGVQKFGKLLDIWLELPVAAKNLSNMPPVSQDEEPVEHILVELPTSDTSEWWFKCRDLFVRNVMTSADNRYSTERFSGNGQIEDLCDRLTLINEYDGPGSPYRTFRDAAASLTTNLSS